MKATAKDLRFHAREILDAVSRGEEVIITYRGKPLAKIIPVNSDKDEERITASLFGIWRDHENTKNVQEYVRKIRRGRI